MLKKSFIVLLTMMCLLSTLSVQAEESQADRDQRMAWWREARFGMFIHWGVYAVPAGTYDGKRIGGIGEWIMLRGKIPVDTYRGYAKEFNPVKYDPDAWVRLAKEAGMKYIVITSKHHDGFALYDSKVTDWDIVDATPYGKDLLKPLEEACKRHGLKLGFYYSQAQDWTHPGGAKSGMKEGEGWDEAHKGDYDEYLKTIAYPQVKEILTRYDIDILWWDTPHWMSKQRADLLRPLLDLRPDIITNNRLGGGYKGDTDTPEQHIPATGIKGRDWETCMTLNGTWGYKSYDANWKSTETLVRNLIDIASKGGNYLLNVGPTAQGEIPQPSIDRLKEVGQWMKVNGESVYDTTASRFKKLLWGRSTTRLHDDDATLYLHVFDWPADGELRVPGLKNQIKTAALLTDKTSLQVQRDGDDVLISLPEKTPDAIACVIALEIEGQPDVVQTVMLARQGKDGRIMLAPDFAELTSPGGESARVETKQGQANIGYWVDSRCEAKWTLQIDQPGAFVVATEMACLSAGGSLALSAADQALEVKAPNTGDYAKFAPVEFGVVKFDKPGQYTLTLKPVKKGWSPVNLRTVTLRPAGPFDLETADQRDARMQWWREARFGMFIHWGLYAVPAGEWNDKTSHAEWIRTTAQIPLDQYDQFVGQFNPVKYDADQWVRLAKAAGMKYIVITSKHHDGFCLWPSEQTDFDIASTPFKRDILGELKKACDKHGVTLCFYHSIMDWRHPDYLPRRGWEKDRSSQGADFSRYAGYMKNQLRELVDHYGPLGVMWFDGEWEGTWTHDQGVDLYDYVRGLQPNIIINNRVDKGRSGMAGQTKTGGFRGDFGTPEQEIPHTGLSGVDWESCMTMNRHWGWNKHDTEWKSTQDLVRKLADITSKGGNFLLNVGPKADGTFPQEAIDRLQAIGQWMDVNGESIHGAHASPFANLTWGRCTQKTLDNDRTRLYLHVFDWPADGKLIVPGLINAPKSVFVLADSNRKRLGVKRVDGDLVITLPDKAPDAIDSVVVLDIQGAVEVK